MATDDRAMFASERVPTLRLAVGELSWLLSRGYADRASLELVGNRHQLHARERTAVRRSACSDAALTARRGRARPLDGCEELAIDGFNLLITLDVALRGELSIIGRDGCVRDLAAAGGLREASAAIALATDHLHEAGVRRVRWLLDRPISHSGRLREQLAREGARPGLSCAAELVDDPDAVLVDHPGPVVSSDARVLDGAASWVNLARELIDRSVPAAWCVDLRPSSGELVAR